MNKKLITNRILSLLEYKNNNYSRKYFILSALSNTNITDDKNKLAEVECFIDSLNKSKGSLPKEDTVLNLYEECLKTSTNSSIKSSRYIKGYVDMLFPENKNIVENIINDEIIESNILFNEAALNKKLKSALIESISRKKSLFIETPEPTKAADLTAADRRRERLDVLRKQEKELFGVSSNSDKLEPVDLGPPQSADAFGNLEKLKTGYKGDKFDSANPGKPILTAMEKLGADAIKIMKGMSTVAKRKFDIINQIHYYLNIQQKLDLIGIEKQGTDNLQRSKERFSFKASGLSEDEVAKYRTHLDNILRKSKSGEPFEQTLETNVITEKELIALLRKSAGKQSSSVDQYLSDLDVRMSLDEEPSDDDYDHDEYMRLSSEFEEKQKQEDAQDLNLDNESYISAEDAALSSSLSKQEKARKLKTLSIEEYKAMSPEAQENVPSDVVIKIFKNGLGHLSDAQRHKIEYKRLVMLSASPEEWESYTDVDKTAKSGRTSLERLTQLSRGRYSGVPGIRQNLQKRFSMAVWLNTDVNYKAEFYYAGFKYYLRAIRELDLIEDKVLQDEDEDVAKSEKIEKTFKEIEMSMTPEVITRYLEEDEDITISELDEIQMNFADALFGDVTSFRMFIVSLFNKFYSNVVWSKWESDLAYAIKEYFESHHPGSGIGQSLAIGMKSKDALKSEGKPFFDTIINYAMGRSGLKSDAAFSIDPHKMKALKKEDFSNTIYKKINAFIKKNTRSNENPEIDETNLKQFTVQDANRLATDILNMSGFIGSVVNNYKNLDEYWVDDFKLFLSTKNISYFTKLLSRSLFMNNWYQERMPEILSNNTFIGKEEEVRLENDASEAIEEWDKLNKSHLKTHRTDLANQHDLATKAIKTKQFEREYKWLDVVDEVMYNGQDAEIKKVDFENQTIILITDDGEVEARIVDVSPIEK
jgi:hypothetical protein